MNKFLNALGYKISIGLTKILFPEDITEEEFIRIYRKIKPYTIIPASRAYSLYKAIRYVAINRISGDLVECGVYKGGSAMLMADTLIESNISDKKIYLYDTYDGMDKPSELDIASSGQKAIKKWQKKQNDRRKKWCYADLNTVKNNLSLTGYPQENFILVKGRVEDTIPATSPDKISVLHLDTDWHSSTYHELYHLFPKVSENGVIIIDDYGYWNGAKKAIDDYFQENNINILLHRTDYSGRIGIKSMPIRYNLE